MVRYFLGVLSVVLLSACAIASDSLPIPVTSDDPDVSSVVEAEPRKTYETVEVMPVETLRWILEVDNGEMPEAVYYGLPEGSGFIPEKWDGRNVLYGRTVDWDTGNYDSIARYDFVTGEYETLVESSNANKSLVLMEAVDDCLYYCVVDALKASHAYHRIDLRTNEDRVIGVAENIEYLQRCTYDFTRSLGAIEVYDEENDTYCIHLWREEDDSFTVIEERASAFPVVTDGHVYYIVIDNDHARSMIIDYDLETGEKQALCETQGSDRYISDMKGNDDFLVFVLAREGKNSAYVWKDGEVDYLFDAGYEWIYDGWYITLMDVSDSGCVAFHTSPLSMDSDTYPYCVYDLENDEILNNGDGLVYLGAQDMAWIEFTVPKEDRDPRNIFDTARIAIGKE